MEDAVEIVIGGPAEAIEMADQITALSVADFAGSSEQSEDHFGGEQFKARLLDDHVKIPGFVIVMALAKGELVGYMFGYPLPGPVWWESFNEALTDEFTFETGSRTFALPEVVVRPEWRGRKIASALYSKILEGRDEERITLMVRPENELAYAIWKHYGYKKIGTADPARDGTTHLDALIYYPNRTTSTHG